MNRFEIYQYNTARKSFVQLGTYHSIEDARYRLYGIKYTLTDLDTMECDFKFEIHEINSDDRTLRVYLNE